MKHVIRGMIGKKDYRSVYMEIPFVVVLFDHFTVREE